MTKALIHLKYLYQSFAVKILTGDSSAEGVEKIKKNSRLNFNYFGRI
ncbi:MAG TPA: hypothetical protein PLG34_04530 [Spirochaetota bacterium]|nr:hypothetical protein [Spirochaetota bacterium]HPY87228.1 hypothetical protein [Spirochaetota bacterium]HQB62251.1 hypothetical protein [Spirochaetota bacterium]HQJ05311.1 hypothetical protein [Spirochaetota bacterium]HRU43785.1 hypothetical protein [Spirochaetota bacterium]